MGISDNSHGKCIVPLLFLVLMMSSMSMLEAARLLDGSWPVFDLDSLELLLSSKGHPSGPSHCTGNPSNKGGHCWSVYSCCNNWHWVVKKIYGAQKPQTMGAEFHFLLFFLVLFYTIGLIVYILDLAWCMPFMAQTYAMIPPSWFRLRLWWS